MKKNEKIVILGAGKVGRKIASDLVALGSQVKLLDRDPNKLTKVEGKLDLALYEGDAGDFSLLRELIGQDSDVCIAVTSQDETNMLACLLAREMDCSWTIARVRGPKYDGEQAFLKHSLGIHSVINPEAETARIIARSLAFPRARRVESYFREEAFMLELVLRPEDSLCGQRLMDASTFTSAGVLVALVRRGNETMVPTGELSFQASDILYLLGSSQALQKVLLSFQEGDQKIRNLLVIGGGRLTQRLLTECAGRSYRVKVIEQDRAKAEALALDFPSVDVIWGDGTDADLLDEEHLEAYDALVVLTGIDEENLLTAVYGRRRGLSRVFCKVDRRAVAELLPLADRPSAFSPKHTIADRILLEVRAHSDMGSFHIERLTRLPDIPIQSVELSVLEGDPVIGPPIADLPFKEAVLLAMIKRSSDVIIPTGADRIQAGDRLVVILPLGEISSVADLLDLEVDDE